MALCHRILKAVHPQGIPWPFSSVYNAVSRGVMFQAHYERVAQDIAAFCAEGSLLDIGTGPGWLLFRLHARCPALRLIGIDISPGMVAQGRRNAAHAGASDRIEFCHGSANQLPFPDASFDVVVSTGSFHHWKDRVAGLNEVHRVLRPGGRALIYDLVKAMPEDVRRQAALEFGRVRVFLLWLHSFEEPFCSPAELEALGQASRFQQGRTGFVGVLCRLDVQKT